MKNKFRFLNKIFILKNQCNFLDYFFPFGLFDACPLGFLTPPVG